MVYNRISKGGKDMKDKQKKHKWWLVPIYIIIAAIVAIIGYLSYVFLSYSRVEDLLPVESTGDAENKVSPDMEYTIVTYNVGFGAYTPDFTFFMDEGKESRARSKESVIDSITGCAETALSYDPDFAVFQEVDTDSTRSFHVNEAELINTLFAEKGAYDNVFATNYHSAYLMYPLTCPHGASNSGLLTQSRFNIDSSVRRSLPIAAGFKKLLDLDRCYNISRIPAENGRELVLINTHLSAYGTDAAQGNAQLEMMFRDMKTEYEKGNYVICGGDFNHDFTTDSKEYFNPGTEKSYTWCEPFPDEIIPEGFRKCTDYDSEMISTTRYTNEPYTKDSFVVILDGFIVSDNIEVSRVSNIDTGYKYTDHNPVVMKFLLKGLSSTR